MYVLKRVVEMSDVKVPFKSLNKTGCTTETVVKGESESHGASEEKGVLLISHC